MNATTKQPTDHNPSAAKRHRGPAVSFFEPKTWAFWRALIIAAMLCCFFGHWLEVPYCWLMDTAFGIVDSDYAAVTDPWYVPYRIYGYGALAMTFVLEPLKELIMRRRKTSHGALLEMTCLCVLLAMLLELGFGMAINQPNAAGVYPYWDNSQLPLNVLGQAWLINDFFIGLVAMVYLGFIFPMVCLAFKRLSPVAANITFALLACGFAACFIISLPYV